MSELTSGPRIIVVTSSTTISAGMIRSARLAAKRPRCESVLQLCEIKKPLMPKKTTTPMVPASITPTVGCGLPAIAKECEITTAKAASSRKASKLFSRDAPGSTLATGSRLDVSDAAVAWHDAVSLLTSEPNRRVSTGTAYGRARQKSTSPVSGGVGFEAGNSSAACAGDLAAQIRFSREGRSKGNARRTPLLRCRWTPALRLVRRRTHTRTWRAPDVLPRQASACSYCGSVGSVAVIEPAESIRAAHDTSPMDSRRLGRCKGAKSPAATMVVEARPRPGLPERRVPGGGLFIGWRGDRRRPEARMRAKRLRRRNTSRHARPCRTRRVPMSRVRLQVSGISGGSGRWPLPEARSPSSVQ